MYILQRLTHLTHSLLHQMKAANNTENDPNNRALKRLKDSDNLLGGQQRQYNNMAGDASIGHTTVPPVDSEMPKSAGLPSKDVPASDQNGSSVKIEHSHICPQMAPSWYGTLKTGPMLSQKTDAVRNVEQPFNIGKVSGIMDTYHLKEQPNAAANNSQVGVILKTPVSSVVPVDHISIPSLHTQVGVQNLVTVKSKKRKCYSWFKEVSGGLKNPQGICTSSMEWSQATNRLMEKVEDDGELIEDVPRAKRRIILSTQLMQQVFPSPPHTVLSRDATSSYESVTFYAARLALGDACNLVSSHSGSNLLSDKSGKSEKTDDHRHSKAVEDCMSKANKLENEFSRLDKRASILDLRVECQDLEKFSIINRFAKFHGRGQGDGEASSSSDAATNIPKAHPQRYVIAVQLPKNLPERVQCLSL